MKQLYTVGQKKTVPLYIRS